MFILVLIIFCSILKVIIFLFHRSIWKTITKIIIYLTGTVYMLRNLILVTNIWHYFYLCFTVQEIKSNKYLMEIYLAPKTGLLTILSTTFEYKKSILLKDRAPPSLPAKLSACLVRGIALLLSFSICSLNEWQYHLVIKDLPGAGLMLGVGLNLSLNSSSSSSCWLWPWVS